MTLSFVFQDGFARIYLDDDKLPCIGKKFHSDFFIRVSVGTSLGELVFRCYVCLYLSTYRGRKHGRWGFSCP